MAKRSSKQRPRDINASAASIIVQSAGQPIPDIAKPRKNPHAVALGSLGARRVERLALPGKCPVTAFRGVPWN